VCAALYVEQEVEPRAREGKEEGSALLALYAELAVKNDRVRARKRSFASNEMIFFHASVSVKDNRKIRVGVRIEGQTN
jgi:hypothetical protein